MAQNDVTPFFHGPRMLNSHFAITTEDLPFVNPCYSMKGEDLIVRELFKGDLRSGRTGFYADIGAYASRYGSNTYLFYQYGWRGICVEPNPNFVNQFLATRPRDILVRAAAGMDGEGYWAEHKAHDAGSRVGLTPDEFGPDFKDPVRIAIVSMKTLFSEYMPPDTEIDYVSIDVEGHELQTLQSNDWSRFRPRVIIIEDNAIDVTNLFASPASAYLRDLGYKVAGVTPPNVIFHL